MKRILKLFWGCIPAALLVICIAIVAIVQSLTGDTLRIIPRNVLICMGIGSFGILLVWVNMKYNNFSEKSDTLISRAIEKTIKILSIIVFSIVISVGLFVMVWTYNPEHVVTRNDIKMVASVRSFLDEYVYYYQYKNPIFYGKKLGYEYYGSGGNDPLAQTPGPNPVQWTFYDLDGNVIDSGSNKDYYEYDNDTTENQSQTILNQKAEIYKPDIEVINNREDELVFSISIDDYVECYNGYHWNDKKTRYLLPSTEWRSQIYDTAIHSNHETIYYYFTEDEKNWSLPTISVYAPTDGDYILEVTVNFDWHSYTDNMYELYEQMCFYTLKVFFPELSDEKIISLYSEANSIGYENVFSSDEWYSKDSVPHSLFYKDGIGVYSYFAIGSWQNLCVIPVTEETIKDFEKKGVKIYEIK